MTDHDVQAITPDTLKTEFVEPATCVFSESAQGFLCATINGRLYPRVILTRALPLTQPDRFICISDTEKNELGILADIGAFPEDQQKLILNELSMRYFCPVIESIQKITEKMGNFYFDVTIKGKKKAFTVKDISKSIRMNGGNIDISDLDGNRYLIVDFDSIPAKSRRMLEPYIY